MPLQIMDPRRGISRRHIPSGGTQSISNQVALDFRSDWAGRTADSQATPDLNDGGKWTLNGNDTWKTVRAASNKPGLPASISRYLEIRVFGTQSSEVFVSNLAKPAVGGSRWYRCYLQWDTPDSLSLGTGSHHPIEPFPGQCPFNWEYRVGLAQDQGPLANPRSMDVSIEGNNAFRWRNVVQAGVEWYDRWMKRTWYCLEWGLTNRTAGDLYNMDIWVSDASGTLLGTDSDFVNYNAPAQTLQNQNPQYNLGSAGEVPDYDCITRMQWGPNGPGSWDATMTAGNETYMLIAGVASSTVGRIGPHAVGY